MGAGRRREWGTNVASPADKDGVINCAEQIQLTNMGASEAPSWRRGPSLVSILSIGFARHSSLQVLSAADAALDIICGWKEN